MIQDIAPSVLYNQFRPEADAAPQDYAVYMEGSKIALKDGCIPTVSDFSRCNRFTYLLTLDDKPFYRVNDCDTLPAGMEMTEIFALRRDSAMPQSMVFAAMTAKHLCDWYRDNRFCGRCGAKMEHAKTERAMKCTCGNRVYPRIMPAVIVGVRNGDKLLLTQYRRGFAHNALIAGFTEIGETFEETVAREVMEEAGVKVKNIRYYKSQPWGVANDILAGFYCDLDGSDEIHMDANELKIAHWVNRGEIELQPDNFSLTNEMMQMFKEGKA